jgi:hypothetical protein
LFEARLTLVGAAVLDDIGGDPPTVPLPALLGPCAPAPLDPPPPPDPPVEALPPARPLPLEDVVADDDVVVELL